MSTPAEPVGTLEVALAHASRLLAVKPAVAAEQAGEILKVIPRQPQALVVLGLARAMAGDVEGSIDALTHAVSVRPDLPDAWLALADQLRVRGDAEAADRAYAHSIKAATRDPQLLGAAAALCENRIPEAEALLRAHLARQPNDVAALRMLAEVAGASAPILRCAAASRALPRARAVLRCGPAQLRDRAQPPGQERRGAASSARVCSRRSRTIRATAASTPPSRPISATTASRSRRTRAVLRDYPQQPEAVDELRACAAHHRQGAGEHRGLPARDVAWSRRSGRRGGASRISRPSASATRTMLAPCARRSRAADLADEDRLHFEFALGKALEDAGVLRGVVRPLRRGQCPAPAAARLRCGGEFALRAPLEAAVHAGILRRSAPARARRRGIRSSSSACRARARRSSSRSSRAIRWSRARWSCRNCRSIARELAGPEARGGGDLSRSGSPRSAADELRALGERLPRRDPRHAQDRRAVLHRQDAEQLHVRRPDPSHPAERRHHRCAAAPARLLLLVLQAAFRARPVVHLRARGPRALLPRLRGAHGAFRRSAAGQGRAGLLRDVDRGHRDGGPAAARTLRAAVRAGMSAGFTRTTAPCARRAPSRCRQPIFRDARRPLASL